MTAIELQNLLTDLLCLSAETEVVEFKEANKNFDFSKLGKYFSALSKEVNLKDKKQAWLVFGVNNSHKNSRVTISDKTKRFRPFKTRNSRKNQ